VRDLSLHILDVVENSVRAGASVVSVSVAEDAAGDRLEIVVEDNGPGMDVPAEVAVDPFYTTKADKRTGLGLSLFRATAEQAGGALAIGQSALGGVEVRATMRLGHVDRMPLGDLAATLSSVVCTNPQLDLWFRFRAGQGECMVRSSAVARELSAGQRRGLALARRVSEKIKASLAALEVTA
jgi:signal transduction histidine kinase